MRYIILLVSFTTLLSCGQNASKQKELELREREIALKEKELIVKEKDSPIKINSIPAPLDTKETEINKLANDISSQNKLPFIGTKTFCILKDEDKASGTFQVTITNEGRISYEFNYKNNGECFEGCEIDYNGKLVGFKAKSEYGSIIFSNENNFKWTGDDEGEFKATLCK